MLFRTGQISATPGVLEVVPQAVLVAALRRHVQGDWGEVDEDDAAENNLSVREGYCILSAYSYGDVKFWVITEADRSATTYLLPSEY